MKISKPTLLLDKEIVLSNIRRLKEKLDSSSVEMKPHFKTHQSKEIGRWIRQETLETINTITVSSVSMAEYFADDGWKYITIAFPLNVLEINKICDLSSRVKLTVLLTNSLQVQALLDEVEISIDVLIEIDAGSKRSGLDPTNDKTICAIIDQIKNTQHHFKGFYSHFGHTYRAKSRSEVTEIFNRSMSIMRDVLHRHADAQPTLSIGDTPSSSVIKDFGTISSFHAGNFIFYDLVQEQIGVCNEKDIAIVLACPIVSQSDSRKEVIIYGGGVHLSKESLYDVNMGQAIYGKMVLLTDTGWSSSQPGCYLRSISQEHGVLVLSNELYDCLNIGDVIGILPVHSCMTADCMGGYRTLDGQEIDHFKSNK